MSASLVYCAIMILVQLLRRPPQPAHPGVAVGMDLVFWLAFIVTGLLGVYAIFSLTLWNDSPRNLQDSGSAYYSGHYHQASNGTWIYKIDWVSQDYPDGNDGYHYNTTTGTYQYNHKKPALSTVKRDCKPEFNTCAEQDAYVNRLWHTQQRREGPVFLVCIIQWLNLLLHFILFVWACVDTHRRNRSKTQSKTQDIADRVLRDMQARGLVMRATGSDSEARPMLAPAGDNGTEMVQRSGALHIGCGCLPIVMERPAPDCEIADFHDNVGGQDIAGGDLDHKCLPEILGETPVQKQQAAFCSPLYGAHALLDEKHCL